MARILSLPKVPRPPINTRARRHGQNKLWIKNGSRAIALAGAHTWHNCQDQLGVPAHDFEKYLDEIIDTYGHNHIRLWAWEYWEAGTAGLIKPPRYFRKVSGKYDLGRVKQAYLNRLEERVQLALDRDVYCTVMLWNRFGHVAANFPEHPFNKDRNISGVDGGSTVDEFFASTTNTPLIDAQKFINQTVIDKLAGFPNVLYEIINEGGATSFAWQTLMVQHVRSITNREVLVNTGHKSGTASDLWATGARGIALPWPDKNIHAPPPAGKLTFADSDHNSFALFTTSRLRKRRFVWESFCRGMHPILMIEHQLERNLRPGLKDTNAAVIDAMKQMGYVLFYCNRANLKAMTPKSDRYQLSSSTEALLFTTGTDSVEVDISGMSGTFNVEWFRPRIGRLKDAPSIFLNGSGQQSLVAPWNESVLYLWRDDLIDREVPDAWLE